MATGRIEEPRAQTMRGDEGRHAGRILRRRLLIAISLTITALTLILAFALAIQANAHHSPPWVDWATYSDAFGRLVQGGSVYDPRQLSGPYHLLEMSTGGAFGYEYPPASLILFAPFASQPIGLVAWLALNVGLLVSGVYAVLRRELGDDAVLYLGLAILPVGLWIGFIEGVTSGNITVGVTGILAWAWALDRERVAPATVAVLGVAKVFPAILVCWTTPSRLVRSVAAAGLLAGAWALITLPIVGPGTWVDFFRAMGNTQPNCDSYGASTTCVLQPFVGIGLAKLAAIALAGSLGVGAVFVRSNLVAFSMVAVAWVVPTYNLSYYSMLPLFVIWVVVFAIGMRRLRSVEIGPRAAGATGPIDSVRGPIG